LLDVFDFLFRACQVFLVACSGLGSVTPREKGRAP
jgi:hypothetical protein